MKLNKIPQSELELLSYTEIAKLYLKENKTTKNTAELFKEVCSLLHLTEAEYVDNIADFFQSLSTTKEFILLEDGTWDLKSNHKIKVDLEELYDESQQDELEESEEELEDLEEMEEEDIDSITDDDSYIDDDKDDDLSELTIVDEDELEE